MERPRRAAASVASASGSYVESGTSVSYAGGSTSSRGRRAHTGKRKRASKREDSDDDETIQDPAHVAAAAASAPSPGKKARGSGKVSSAAAASAASAASCPASAPAEAEFDTMAFDAAVKPGFHTLSVYQQPIGRNRAVLQWIQVQDALKAYAERTDTKLLQAGDLDYDPSASGFYMLNTSSSCSMVAYLERALREEVSAPLKRGDRATAFLHLLTLTMSAKYHDHWFTDVEEAQMVNSFMKHLAQQWTALFACSDQELQLENHRWEGERPENKRPARDKVESMLAEFGKEVKQRGKHIAGHSFYQFPWKWKA